MKRYIFFLITTFLFIDQYSVSQTFIDINAGLTDVTFSSAAWGDYDNDADLDLIIMGMDASNNYHTIFYKNQGNDIFIEVTGLPFTNLAVGDVAFGDLDNDGDLDLLMEGATNSGSSFTRIYENKGNDTFSEVSVSLEQLYDGAVSWADYNNDGYLDIMYSGFDDVNGIYSAFVYSNNKDGSFTLQTSLDFPGAIKGNIKWADYDKDGDMDLLYTGLDFSSTLISRIYKNNGIEGFSQAEIILTGIWLGDAAWGDFDIDGDLDLLLTGFNFSGRIAKIYVNEGNDTFTELPGTPFPGLSHSSAEWGDYDNDGDLDILFCGVDEQGGWIYYTMIYTNNGDNTFTESNITLETVYWGESLWGDYDADGDLDLVLTGYKPNGQVLSAIYRNDIGSPNTPPQPPDSLFSTVNMNEVTLSWSLAEDNETLSEGLTYNAYLYKLDADTIWSPMSVFSTGKRLLPDLGNTNQDTSWTIKDLPDGHYFWSIQALDNNYEGSAFATEANFIVGMVGLAKLPLDNISIFPNPAKDRITISNVKGNKLIVLNSLGAVVLERKIVKDKLNLDVSDFVDGVYYLQFSNSGNRFAEKLIIAR